MMYEPTATVVQVKLRHDGHYYYASSDDVFGLHLCGEDRNAVLRDIPKLIKILVKENSGVDVEVQRYEEPRTFPQSLAIDEDQFVVHAVPA